MKIEKVGASLTKQLDVGFRPYMEYLESLNGRSPAFGTRENSRIELNLWKVAIIEEGDDPNAVLQTLIDDLNTSIDSFLGGTFTAASVASADEYAYTEVKTAINPEGDPNDW